MAAPATVPTNSRLQRTEAALAAETAARDKSERALSEAYAVVRDLQTKIGHAELAKNEALESLRREREAANLLRGEAEGWETRLKEAEDRAQAAEDTAADCQDELASERHARKAAEKALRIVEAARDAAEQLIRTLSEETPQQPRAAVQRAGRSAQQGGVAPVHAEPVHAGPVHAEPVPVGRVQAGPAQAGQVQAGPPRRGRPPITEPEAGTTSVRRPRPVETATPEPTPEPEPVKWWLNTKAGVKRKTSSRTAY